MKFNPPTGTQIEDSQSLVSPDRFSAGESVHDLHSGDQSHDRFCRPEAVIWPIRETDVLVAESFGHAGGGSVHIVFNAPALAGPATAEHGAAIGKREFMEKERGNSLKRIRALFDPNGILSPGKIFV